MDEKQFGSFQLSLGDVLLQAPETPQYLAIAAHILEIRQREIGTQPGEAPVAPPERPAPRPQPAEAPPRTEDREATAPAEAPPAPPVAPRPPRATRRGRWFSDQLPQVTLEDGSTRVLHSQDDLRELLQSRGLQPHPRGDASMLLWQVRNRLGLAVEPVPVR